MDEIDLIVLHVHTGGSGGEIFEERFQLWRETRVPQWSWGDEKIWTQEYCETVGSVHQRGANPYHHGIHVIWWAKRMKKKHATIVLSVAINIHLAFKNEHFVS